MTTMTKFLMACSTVALPLAVASVLPFAAAAQSNDAAYCTALSNAYRHTTPNGVNPDATIPVAMARCAAGDTVGGIPVLEQALRDAKVTLPRRS